MRATRILFFTLASLTIASLYPYRSISSAAIGIKKHQKDKVHLNLISSEITNIYKRDGKYILKRNRVSVMPTNYFKHHSLYIIDMSNINISGTHCNIMAIDDKRHLLLLYGEYYNDGSKFVQYKKTHLKSSHRSSFGMKLDNLNKMIVEEHLNINENNIKNYIADVMSILAPYSELVYIDDDSFINYGPLNESGLYVPLIKYFKQDLKPAEIVKGDNGDFWIMFYSWQRIIGLVSFWELHIRLNGIITVYNITDIERGKGPWLADL